MSTTKDKIALVDGDVLLFRAAMAGQYFLYSAYLADLDVPIYSCRYKADLMLWLEENDVEVAEVRIDAQPQLEELPAILHTVKLMVRKLWDRFDDVEIYLSGGENFREQIAFEQPYKGNRWSKEKREAARKEGKWLDWLDATESTWKEAPRPHWEPQVREYLIDRYEAKVVVGQEADDELGIRQTELGDHSCIVSVDKDLNMIPGWHLDMTDLDGGMYYSDQVMAMRLFYEQLLKGDNIDNILGLRGIGKVKAEKALEGIMDPDEMFDVVWNMYVDKLAIRPDVGQEVYDIMVQRGRLLWIRRKEDELWTPPKSVNSLLGMIQAKS